MAILSIGFATLKANYFIGHTNPADVKKAIGGAVNADYITNTCVIKVSRALNGSAATAIPNIKGDGLMTVKGADGKNYALRVKEFKRYITNKYGQPDLVYDKSKPAGKQAADFLGQTGIILFDVNGWADATGHVTLWDGSKCIDATNYWDKAHIVSLWSVK